MTSMFRQSTNRLTVWLFALCLLFPFSKLSSAWRNTATQDKAFSISAVSKASSDSIMPERLTFPDSVALAAPETAGRSVSSLVAYLKQHLSTDDQLARAIYTWVSRNIKYNVYITYTSRNEEADETKEIQKILKEKALYKKAKKQYKMGLYEDALDTINKIEDYEPAASFKEKIENKIASMPPETPILTEFYDATVEGEETTIGVDWTSSQGASEYEYWVKETPCFADGTIWEELQPDVNTGTTVDLSYATSASDPLMVQIRVRAVKYHNGEKIYSDWSSLVTGYMNVY